MLLKDNWNGILKIFDSFEDESDVDLLLYLIFAVNKLIDYFRWKFASQYFEETDHINHNKIEEIESFRLNLFLFISEYFWGETDWVGSFCVDIKNEE